MDFVDSLRRGVDRAGFELDRLLRANRVRSRIHALRSQMDEELRGIGLQVVELCESGQLVLEQVSERCAKVKQYQAEIAKKEAELDAINREVLPPAARCASCGAELPEDAIFCPRCGTSVKAMPQASAPTAGQGAPQRIPVELETGEQEEARPSPQTQE